MPKGLSPNDLSALVATLEGEGYRITKKAPVERAQVALDLKYKPGGSLKVGIVSDTHIGSTLQQMTALHDFYKYADSKGAAAFLHGGDVLEGIHQAHRDAAYEQYAHGVDAQVKAVADQYPKSANGTTYHIAGNHDDWAFQNVGVTSGRLIEQVRPDMKYIGYHSAFVDVSGVRFLLQHGSRGGGSYAKSYKPQKLIEGLSDADRAVTDVALFGHWHNELYLGRYLGMFGFMLPCFKAQDRFLRSLGKNPTIGGLLLEIEFTRDRKVWNIRPDFRYYSTVVGDFPGGEQRG